jgi:hypothetical protein
VKPSVKIRQDFHEAFEKIKNIGETFTQRILLAMITAPHPDEPEPTHMETNEDMGNLPTSPVQEELPVTLPEQAYVLGP